LTKVVVDNGGTNWLTPAATLVAVLVGGLLSWWVQWWQTKRREEGEAKAAARVVQGDLAIAASSLQNMVERDQHWYGFYDLRLPNWGERQAVLALHLTPEQWEAVSQSALELDDLTEVFWRIHGPDPPRGTVVPLDTPERLKDIRDLWQQASDAHRALAELAETKPEQGLLHEGALSSGPPPALQQKQPPADSTAAPSDPDSKVPRSD
jgi:hypothetical protein